MTAAYTPLDANAPNGGQSPAAFATSALANIRALRDAVVCGHVPGFAYSQNGGSSSAPTNRVWANAATSIQFRLVAVAYDGTITYMPTQVKWQWSDDNGGTWADMDATASVITWDTASDLLRITAVSRNAGLWVLALQGLVGALHTITKVNAHAALTYASGVHGMGTMAGQNATNVAITGGNINGTVIGATTRAHGNFTRVTEEVAGLAPALNAGVTVDLSKGMTVLTNNGVNAITFSGAPSGASGHMLYCSNFNNTTFPGTVNWGAGGKPSINGAAWVILFSNDMSTGQYGSVAWQAV